MTYAPQGTQQPHPIESSATDPLQRTRREAAGNALRWFLVALIFIGALTLAFLDTRATATAYVVGWGIVGAFALLLLREVVPLLLRRRSLGSFLTFLWVHNVLFGLLYPLWHYALAVRAFGPHMHVDWLREAMTLYLLAALALMTVLYVYWFVDRSLRNTYRALLLLAFIPAVVALVGVGIAYGLGMIGASLAQQVALVAGGFVAGVLSHDLAFFFARYVRNRNRGNDEFANLDGDDSAEDSDEADTATFAILGLPRGAGTCLGVIAASNRTVMTWYVFAQKLISHLALATVFFWITDYRPFLPTLSYLEMLQWLGIQAVPQFLRDALALSHLEVLQWLGAGSAAYYVLVALLALPLIFFLFMRRHFTTVVAFRFVVRRRLSYMAMMTVALGVVVLMLVTGVMGGFKHELRERVRGSLSHVFYELPAPDTRRTMDELNLGEDTSEEALGRLTLPLEAEMLGVSVPDEAPREYRAWLIEAVRAQDGEPVLTADPETGREYTNDELLAEGIARRFPQARPLEDLAERAKLALRETYQLPRPDDEELRLSQVVLQAHAKRLDAPQWWRATTAEDFLASMRMLRTRQLLDERREAILRLNDPDYRAELRQRILAHLESMRETPAGGFTLDDYRYASPAEVEQYLRETLASLERLGTRDTNIVEGASGRLRTMALIVQRGRSELDYVQLFGIDPIHDLTISELGLHLEQAQYKEMQTRLAELLRQWQMYVIRLFHDDELPERFDPRRFDPRILTEVGRQLYEQLSVAHSLVTKVTPRDPGSHLEMREAELLADARSSLTEILNARRDRILDEVVRRLDLRERDGRSPLEQARMLALVTPERRRQMEVASAHEPLFDEYQRLGQFRDRVISGRRALNEHLEQRLDDYFDDFESVGLRGERIHVVPDALRDELRDITREAQRRINRAPSYKERLELARKAATDLLDRMRLYRDEQWPQLRQRLEQETGLDLGEHWSALPGIVAGRLTLGDLETFDENLHSMVRRSERRYKPTHTFWEFDGGYMCLDRILEYDMPKVRAMLLDMVEGTGPFAGVRFGHHFGGGLVVSRTIPDQFGEAGRSLQVGDVLVSLGETALTDFGVLRDVLAEIRLGATVQLVIERDGVERTLSLSIEKEFHPGVRQIVPFERFSAYWPGEALPPGREPAESDRPQTLPADEDDLFEHERFVPREDEDERESGQVFYPPILAGDRLAAHYGTFGRTMMPDYFHARLHLATAVQTEGQADGTRVRDEFEAREQGFHIASLFHSRLFEDDRRRVYLRFNDALQFLDGADTQVIVGVKLGGERWANTPQYKPLIAAAVADLTEGNLNRIVPAYRAVSTWEEERATLLQAVDREEILLTVVLSVIILYAGVMIVIIIYLMVREKTKDIGILKALGGSPDGIQSIFLFNGLFIGLFGSLIGLAIGVTMIMRSNWIEDTIERIFGFRIFPADVYYLTYIPMKVDPWTWVMICIPTILLSFLFALYPANQAAQLDPVESLQYE